MFGDDRKVRFKAVHAARLAPFIGLDGTRYWMSGLYVEPFSDGVLLVATNGYRLGMIYDDSGTADSPWICALPQPLARGCRQKRAGDIAFIGQVGYVLDPYHSGDPATIGQHHLAIAHAPPIDGTFTNFRRGLPKELPGGSPSPTYRRADIDAFAADRVQIFAVDEQPTFVLPTDADMVGLIMPFRPGPVPNPLPDWYARVMAPEAPARQPDEPAESGTEAAQ